MIIKDMKLEKCIKMKKNIILITLIYLLGCSPTPEIPANYPNLTGGYDYTIYIGGLNYAGWFTIAEQHGSEFSGYGVMELRNSYCALFRNEFVDINLKGKVDEKGNIKIYFSPDSRLLTNYEFKGKYEEDYMDGKVTSIYFTGEFHAFR